MQTNKHRISVGNNVDGIEVVTSAEKVLLWYCIGHIIGTLILSYLFSQTVDLSRYSSTTETNWVLFSAYALTGFGTLVIIYTISNLLIQLYANTVATREAVYYYINKQLEEKE